MESQRINTWIDGVVSKMEKQQVLATADSQAVFAKIVATILERFNDKVRIQAKNKNKQVTVGSKKKNYY